jgi:hypothetical protein
MGLVVTISQPKCFIPCCIFSISNYIAMCIKNVGKTKKNMKMGYPFKMKQNKKDSTLNVKPKI